MQKPLSFEKEVTRLRNTQQMSATQQGNRQEYIERINRVLDYIEKNLDADLSLEVLAQQAFYSSFYFHRIFTAVVGETLSELITRKRMERVASILITQDQRAMRDLAFEYGFNSESAFSRAFKKYYGMSPTQFKKKQGKEQLSKMGIAIPQSEKYLRRAEELTKWLHMNAQIRIQELPEIQLAGIAQSGNFHEMVTLFQELMKWGVEKEVLDMEAFKAITLYHDNPRVTASEKARFSACVTVREPIKADGRIRPLQIEKGLYAVGHFTIDAQDFAKAWDSMCIWVLDNGHAFRDGDFFEAYLNDASTHPEGKFIIDICLPVTPSKTEKQENRVADNGCMASSANETGADYHELIGYMKKLKGHFTKRYDTGFAFGNVYQGHQDYSYLSLTPVALKKEKLKFVILLDHYTKRFRICLSGQNKAVRKKYWKLFRDSDWDQYPLVTDIDNSLFIMDHVLVEAADFSDADALNLELEQKSMAFIQELSALLT